MEGIGTSGRDGLFDGQVLSRVLLAATGDAFAGGVRSRAWDDANNNNKSYA